MHHATIESQSTILFNILVDEGVRYAHSPQLDEYTKNNEIQRCTSKLGDKYVGTIQYQKYHGHGKIIYKFGTEPSYVGQWVNKKREGFGVNRFSNGDHYVG